MLQQEAWNSQIHVMNKRVPFAQRYNAIHVPSVQQKSSDLKTTRKKNYELFSKAKIELHLFQQYFTPHTPLLKQGESETTLAPDLPSTRIIRSTIPFRKCFKSCSPM
jgi:hypothetical protein